MRRLGMLAVVALGAICLLISLDHPVPLPAAGPPSDKTISFRIVFGEKQQRREDDSGSLALNEGKVINVTPWRLYGEDGVNPDGSWKVHVKLISFENQPDAPRPMDTSDAVFNYVPAGVTLTVEAPPTATAQVRTAQGDFHFALQELDLRPPGLSFRDGDVVVQRTPTPQQISPVPQGANPEEHDYPSICVTRKGVVWIAWQAYQNLGDQVYVRYSTPSGLVAARAPDGREGRRLSHRRGRRFRRANLGCLVGKDGRGLGPLRAHV